MGLTTRLRADRKPNTGPGAKGEELTRRQYIGWIESAKREETKARRLQEAIRLLMAGKPLGLK